MTSPAKADQIAIHVEQDLFGSSQDQFLQNEEQMSIAELIPQILAERRSFLNITEESLEEEIRKKNSDMDLDDGDAEQDSPDDDAAADTDTALQLFQKQKMELLAHLNSALNETSLSLDFVSLLMSAEKPNVVKATISPHLSKTVPLGSLSADRLEMTAEEKSQNDAQEAKARTESIGLGWKYQALKNVTSLFKESSDQLRAQVGVEKAYWNNINKVLGHNEVLFKVRDPATNARAVGVQYGYGDSGSSYHDKGLAVLRKSQESGDLVFSPLSSGSHKLANSASKYTRVRILSKIDDDYMLTGQSTFDPEEIQKGTSSEDAVMKDIAKARYFLFEEDLFYHLIREAKNLINYNVTIIADKIIIDVFDQIIELEAVVYDEFNDDDVDNLYQNTNEESSKNNGRAQDILIFLKLMMCCFYNYNLELKQKIPTLFTKWKQHNSHPLILRPLIGHIRHQMNCKSIASIIANIRSTLSDQLTCTVTEAKYKNLEVAEISNPFQKAVQKPESSFSFVLRRAPAEHLSIDIDVTSSEIFVDLIIKLTVSKYKSEADFEQNQNGINVLQLTFHNLIEVEECLSWTIQNFSNAK